MVLENEVKGTAKRKLTLSTCGDRDLLGLKLGQKANLPRKAMHSSSLGVYPVHRSRKSPEVAFTARKAGAACDGLGAERSLRSFDKLQESATSTEVELISFPNLQASQPHILSLRSTSKIRSDQNVVVDTTGATHSQRTPQPLIHTPPSPLKPTPLKPTPHHQTPPSYSHFHSHSPHLAPPPPQPSVSFHS